MADVSGGIFISSSKRRREQRNQCGGIVAALGVYLPSLCGARACERHDRRHRRRRQLTRDSIEIDRQCMAARTCMLIVTSWQLLSDVWHCEGAAVFI